MVLHSYIRVSNHNFDSESIFYDPQFFFKKYVIGSGVFRRKMFGAIQNVFNFKAFIFGKSDKNFGLVLPPGGLA